MSSEKLPADEQEFYRYWGNIIATCQRISDSQLDSLLTSTEWSEGQDIALAQLAVRMILNSAQVEKTLTWAKSRRPRHHDVERELRASAILLDSLKGPLCKLSATLDLAADWASALAIQEVLPWYINHARKMILASDRPDSIKSHLIRVVNAHSDEMRQTMDF